jgi:hypothetical protein
MFWTPDPFPSSDEGQEHTCSAASLQTLWLALSNIPHKWGVFFPLHEGGNTRRSRLRDVVLSTYFEFRKMGKVQRAQNLTNILSKTNTRTCCCKMQFSSSTELSSRAHSKIIQSDGCEHRPSLMGKYAYETECDQCILAWRLSVCRLTMCPKSNRSLRGRGGYSKTPFPVHPGECFSHMEETLCISS